MASPEAGSQRSFLHSVGRTAGFNLAATALGAVNGVFLARWLGPSGRGDYAAVTAYFGLSLVVFELGLGSSVVYHVSKYRSARADYVKTASMLLVPLALVASLIAVVLGVVVFGDSPSRRAAFIVLPLSVAICFAGAPASFALQSLDITRCNHVSLSQPTAILLIVIGAHLITTLDVPLVVNLMAGTFAIQALLAWWLYTRLSSRRGRWERKNVRPLLRFGALNMSSTAPNALNSRLDQLVLALLVSSAALGQYAVAVSLSVLAGPLVMAFGHVAFPGLARGEQVVDTIKTAIKGSIAVSVVSLALILAAGPFVVPVLFGPGYTSVTVLLLVLAPGAAVVVVNQVLGDLLRGLGRPGAVAVCEWVGIVSTVVGLVLLVPHLGVMGAAVTSTITYVVVFVLLLRFVSKQVYVHNRRHADDVVALRRAEQ